MYFSCPQSDFVPKILDLFPAIYFIIIPRVRKNIAIKGNYKPKDRKKKKKRIARRESSNFENIKKNTN